MVLTIEPPKLLRGTEFEPAGCTLQAEISY